VDAPVFSILHSVFTIQSSVFQKLPQATAGRIPWRGPRGYHTGTRADMASKSVYRGTIDMQFGCGIVLGVLAVLATGCSRPVSDAVRSSETGQVESVQTDSAIEAPPEPRQINIVYPLAGALVPPEIAAPTLRWEDDDSSCDGWRIEIRFQDGPPMEFRSDSPQWTPDDEDWEAIKGRSRSAEAVVTVAGVDRAAPDRFVSRGSTSLRTSNDEVGAPIFYREVNLPFRDAVKDPSRIRWRFGEISARQPPPVVLEKLPVCGNCHSFSADGRVLGMDVDYANDKGSYVITDVAQDMILGREHVITWGDYRKEARQPTFGLLSHVSPDGRYVASTVKDRSVFVATDDLAFSQLFFPIKGIVAIYDRQTKEFRALPGTDDPRLVQSNPVWSPDGKYLVFARSEAYQLKNLRSDSRVLLTQAECREFLKDGKVFRFDLYLIPFNGGRGGTPEPLAGASDNGLSNYFPRFSPDGKWIVFCRAKSFMLLQPDSELHLIPAEGGEARRLRCNTSRMNSWHSWSPNGKWLVFSSKAFSPYTQLFLTHIDEAGESSVPVLLDRFAASDRAANIPEFVNTKPGAIRQIAAAFLDDSNYFRAAYALLKWGRDPVAATPLLRQSLKINPQNIMALLELATILTDQGKLDEAKTHIATVLDQDPDDVDAHHCLAVVLAKEGKHREAADHCRRALERSPNSPIAHLNLGRILLETGQADEAVEHLGEALRLDPTDATANYYWGYILQRREKPQEAAVYYRHAVELDSEFIPAMLGLASLCIANVRADSAEIEQSLGMARKACDLTGYKDVQALRILAGMYAVAGQFREAAGTARKALEVAHAAGDMFAAREIQAMLELYEKLSARKRN